jgi:hypothetical protein
LIQIPLGKEDFYKESHKMIEPDLIKSIF